MHALFSLLLLIAAPTSTLASQVLPAPATAHPIDPFPYLNGGSFSGPALAFHPDPLGAYVWGPSVNASQLQLFYLLPASVSVTADTQSASTAFQNLSSLLAPNPYVRVAGPGGIQLDYGVENAAWLEFDSPDFPASQLGALTLGISEYDEYGIFNTGPKVGVPVAHQNAVGVAGVTTYRLELNPDLFEGVRYGWIWFGATPAQPWHITGLRLVCQIKPTNWGGSFAAAGDTLLNKIWYAGAYTTKVNLLSDQFGSILIYRGDRFSWTGDAHVAQATAITALGNFDFVLQNTNFTKLNCNGIESYCLYWVLSVCDYYAATGDKASTLYFADYVSSKLEHTHDIWGTVVNLGFYGWDDRLGSGFANSTCEEAEAAYRFLAIRSWRAWAQVLVSLGETAQAAHFQAYADTATNTTRADSTWYTKLGIFAAADAINAGVPSAAETSAIIARLFQDQVTICGLSNFNTWFVLQALAAAGHLDLGLEAIHRCWDVQILLGATTVWETSQPDWQFFLTPGPPGIPGFEDGFTSMAHPWGSGATSWASQWLLGVRPTSPGYTTFVVMPHLAGNMSSLRGTVPTLRDTIGVHAVPQTTTTGASVRLHVPAGTVADLKITSTLLARLGVSGSPAEAKLASAKVFTAQSEDCLDVDLSLSATSDPTPFPLMMEEAADTPMDRRTGQRSRVATLRLGAGCHQVVLSTPAPLSVPHAPPGFTFPPPSYPAALVARDDVTAGSWMGVYGSAGFSLFAYDGADLRVERLPSFVSGIVQSFGRAQNGPWPSNGTDPRALQDPRNPTGARKIGQYSVPLPWEPNWDPSYVMDIELQPAAEGNVTYRLAVYCVDFDIKGRRQTITVMDRFTLNPITPPLYLTEFTGGVWLVLEYNRSMRLRFNYVRGDNQVVSAMMFDIVA